VSEIEFKKDSKTSTMLISSIVFGIMFQLLFYEKIPGISISIFIGVFYAVFFINFRDSVKKAGFFEYALILSEALLSLTYALFTDPLFMFFNIFFIAVLIAAHTLLITESGLHSWYATGFAADLIKAFFYRPFAYFLKPFAYIGKLAGMKVKGEKYKTLTKVLIGLVIAVPILVVVLTLLSSADMIFNSFLGNLTEVFKSIKIGDLLPRIVLTTFAALMLFSYLWSITIKRSKNIKETANIREAFSVDSVIIITVLASVDIVYLLFTFIQFSYLFGSLNLYLPMGYTYAEYARRGFFELVVVTVINLIILLGALNFTKIPGKTSIKASEKASTSNKAINLLDSILVCCTLVILFSAHFRMSMYENVYGYTYLRLLTHAFMLFIFVLLLIALIKVWYSRLILLKWYVITAVVAYTLINFANVNAVIAKNNIDRYHKTGKIDVDYLTSLSYEAVPYISELYNELKDKGKESASTAAILKEHLQDQKIRLEKDRSWQSFNLSRYKARKVLAVPSTTVGT
jgi:hypothetical protein